MTRLHPYLCVYKPATSHYCCFIFKYVEAQTHMHYLLLCTYTPRLPNRQEDADVIRWLHFLVSPGVAEFIFVGEMQYENGPNQVFNFLSEL